MALNGVSTYTKPHGSGKQEGGGGGGIQIINRYGGSNINPANLNVTNLSAYKASIDNLTVKNGDIDNCNIRYLMSPTGEITKLEGNDLNYKYGYIAEIVSDSIETNKITAKQEGNIKNLISDFIQANNITTDNLTVTKSAHFFELIVDKIRSVQGTQINTAANCVADYVEGYSGTYHDYRDTKVDVTSNNVDYFRVYWKNNDDNGKAIKNEWLAYDQAICQSFGVDAQISQNVQNKYYWRLVEKTDEGTPKYVNFATEQVKNSKPDFNITIANGFGYGYSYSYNYIPFTVRPQATGEWTSYAYTYSGGVFSPQNTIYGLEVTLDEDDPRYLCGGDLVFDTDIDTMLNVGVYYNDGTFEYNQADTYKKRYVIPTADEKNVEAFIINTAVIDQWDACNWIDLSNSVYDTDVAKGSSIPEAGDNICQLGYRYDMLANPTTADEQRASAIIIAAYQTPDNGDSSVSPAIPAIFPPSYAQYQNINRFNLAQKRGTYFDATGAYIKGRIMSGSTIDESFTVNVEQWEFVGTPNIMSTNNTFSPASFTLKILFKNSNSSVLYDSIPSGKKLYVNNTRVYSLTITSAATLNIQLKDANDNLLCAAIINANSTSLLNGVNGSYYQNIYKNDLEQPSTPQDDQQHSYPPSGWTTSPTTLAYGDYTWMSQRTVTFDSSNNPSYSNWSTPVRMTGENGEEGEDGNGVELIYAVTNDVDPISYLPIFPNMFQTQNDVPDPTSPNVHFNPDGVLDRWTEYVNGSPIYHSIFDEDWVPPSRQSGQYFTTDWTDDPQGVSEEILFEGVAQRTYNGRTGEWSLFSTPVTWSHFGLDGADGTNGINGTNGANGKNAFNNFITYDKLDCSVTVSGDTLTTITSGIKCILQNLMVYHIEDGVATPINIVGSNAPGSSKRYTLYLDVLTSNSGNKQSFTVTNIVQSPWTSTQTGKYNINQSNLLNVIYPASSYTDSYYRDYLKLQTQNVGYLPIQLAIYVAENGVQCTDKIIIDLNMHAGYINQMSELGLVQAFFGSFTYNGQTVNGISTITATMNGIETDVQSLQLSYNSLYSDYSSFKQTSNTFQTTVTSQITDINNDLSYQGASINTISQDYLSQSDAANTYETQSHASSTYTTQSQVTQTATSISAQVKTDIEGDLQTTGIDIENGKINLNADNTNINGNLNVYNAKQGIIVYDSNNNPKISVTADNLGASYDSYSTNIGQAYDNWYESTTKKAASTATYTAPIVDISLGYLKNGTELILSTSAGSTDWYNENNYIDVIFYKNLIDGNYSEYVLGSISNATYLFTFSNGSVTITRTGSFTIDSNRLYLPNINVTLTANGNWTMSGNITLTLTGDKYSLACYYCGRQMFYIKGADQAVNKISLDGMLIKPSNSNVNWFGSDMTVFSNGLHEIRVTSNGIKERNYINANTGTYNENPLSCSQKIQLVSTDGTSINNDTTFVLIGNNISTINVLLPQSTGNDYIEGRTIYIKNNSTKAHNIVADIMTASYGRVIPKDKTLADVASSTSYDNGRYWTIPAKTQVTVVCVHNEDMNIPAWFVF